MKPNSNADELIPPFGLGYLATAIRENYEVEILDGIKEELNLEKFEQIVKKENYDVIGIQIFTFHLNTAKDYIKIIKKVNPEIKIILGGPHPSCDPKNIFKYFPDIDFAFRGEAEEGLPRLLNLISEEKNQKISNNLFYDIPGLIFKDEDGKTIFNNPSFVENLDAFGLPSWDLLKPDTYPLSPHGAFFKNYPIAPIVITRGCPYSCTYCAGPIISGRKIRKRSIDNVIEEIKLLYHKYGIREIHIEDDNFTLYNDLVKEFCYKLKENNLNISWACPNGIRLDTLSKDLLLLMKNSGLYSVSVGIESGSDKILNQMKKSLTTEKIKEKLNLIKSAGLEAIGFFIIGYPTETKKDILKTLAFAKGLPLKRVTFSIFKPFPGTEITNYLVEKGELDLSKIEWDKFLLADAVWSPRGLTLKEIKKLRRRAFLEFYLRPKILIKMLSEIKSFSHFKIVLRRIYRWLFKF
ncbi:MAG: hypothetical protein A3A94_00750 [Candidatus Portnoybacteria bacterium RIFCSPLOWO2_01_FULL_43_11]|nr:MAG: hypothetical protein A3D38_00215 [Candidatus Portnoybacteria bacterium RIFCSPHIGHO2_02_FULL_40_23]OGZ38391.1 MAG: hypothetical protein A3E90_02585 [Candidatus Portnoybacteria bacterium RIFCSPHIGHO2_12_FULL_40_11]OGZ38560.1 MAG: hypothetical protein A3A94_00750 [Candidatus Portnoybacteria bacterium RIFCSPLOWO2_01_FULL_43_11]